jgi:hypothetical protein
MTVNSNCHNSQFTSSSATNKANSSKEKIAMRKSKRMVTLLMIALGLSFVFTLAHQDVPKVRPASLAASQLNQLVSVPSL